MLRFTPMPLALVVVDIDDFKQVNEEHGHQVGDEVLRLGDVTVDPAHPDFGPAFRARYGTSGEGTPPPPRGALRMRWEGEGPDGQEQAALVTLALGLQGRLHQVEVQLPWVLDRLADRLRRDLVEHHPAYRNLRLQLLPEVPGDRLALPVLVGGEVELRGLA